MSDRGYGYPQPPRSPVMRAAHPARSSAGSVSSSRDPYYDSYYSNSRPNGERAPVLPPRSDPRQFDRPLPYRGASRDDYDVAPRRLAPERGHDVRERAGSAVPEGRRPLSILPPSERDRVRPQIYSAGHERPRGSDRRDDYYVIPASSTRTGHGRHLSAEIDPQGRYAGYSRPPPQYVDAPRDNGRYYGPEPGRHSDQALVRRALDPGPRGSRDLYPEQGGRPRAGSDVGTRERPSFTPEYVRERPRQGPPPSTRGFDKLDKGVTKYRVPREDAASSTNSAGGRSNTGPYERRHLGEKPITLHQDYDYGYSSAEERGGPGRNKLIPANNQRRRDESRDRIAERDRRPDERYDSDTSRRSHNKHHREPSARRDREKQHHHRDDSYDRHAPTHRNKREDSEDRHTARTDEDRRSKGRRDDYEEEDRHRRRHEEKERDRDRDRDRERDRDRDRGDDKNRKIAETLGLGGAGAAIVGIAREALKKRTEKFTGGGNTTDDDVDRDRSDRYGGDDGLRRHKRDETDEQRKERHRKRREAETEEEREERHRKRRERRSQPDGDKDRDGNRDHDGKEDDGDKDRSRDRLKAGGLGAAAGALGSVGVGAMNTARDKSRDRSRARFEDGEKDKDKDDAQRRRRRRRHTSESDTSSSSESDVDRDRDRAPPTRSRASSAARPPPPKGILKQPTQKFPEKAEAIREGVAPLKDAKGQKGIPPNARWTKVDRRLVNPAALQEAQERFEERTDHVIVLRVLTREDIEKLAKRTQEIRDERHRRDSEAGPADKDHDRVYAREAEEQRRMDEENNRPPLQIEAVPHNGDSSMDNIVQQAAAQKHSSRNGSRNNSPPMSGGASSMLAHPEHAPPPQDQRWESQERENLAYDREMVKSPESMQTPMNGFGDRMNGGGSANGSRRESGEHNADGRLNGSGNESQYTAPGAYPAETMARTG